MTFYKILFKSLDNLSLENKYIINLNYNNCYINSRNIINYSDVLVKEIQTNSKNKIFAAAFQTVWLLNIDRLILHSKINCENYYFLDVGCGKGISTIYTLDNYNFKSVSGFDFSSKLIQDSKINIEKSNIKNKNINFFTADASTYLLDNKSTVIYMFNPFENNILTSFLDNNIENIRNTKSVIFLCNDKSNGLILDYIPVDVIYIKDYNCSIYLF